MNDKKEHPQAKWLIALAAGETLQSISMRDNTWHDLVACDVLSLIACDNLRTTGLRIKPKTITVGKYEVAEPMRVAPPHLTEYWGIQGGNATGVYGDIWSDCSFEKIRLKSGMMWAKREDAELAAKAITELLTGAQ